MNVWKNRSVRQAQSLLGGTICLLALLCGQAQLLPSMLALGAVLEASHTVRVTLDEGTFTLALHHEAGQPGRTGYTPRRDPGSAAHKHGLMARCVCALSTSNDQPPDHVACFANGLAAEHLLRAVTSKARSHESSAQFIVDFVAPSNFAVAASLPHNEAHAPPFSFALQSLRSVSLLI